MEDAHMKTVDEVVKYYGADPERGLSADQVKKNQEKYGPNGEVFNRLNVVVKVHLSAVILMVGHKITYVIKITH